MRRTIALRGERLSPQQITCLMDTEAGRLREHTAPYERRRVASLTERGLLETTMGPLTRKAERCLAQYRERYVCWFCGQIIYPADLRQHIRQVVHFDGDSCGTAMRFCSAECQMGWHRDGGVG